MNKHNKMPKWGFLRETRELAVKAGIDKDTGLHRTGLDEYLEVIFPEISDWEHDKTFPHIVDGKKCRKRPDYRSETLKLIIEVDGLPHYTNPQNILKDKETTLLYESFGYKVVRIPYFIQLTNNAVKQLFDRDVEEPLFDENIPSLGVKGNNTPAFLCYAGIERMKEEFRKFPEQYQTNKKFLLESGDLYLTRVDLIEISE